MPTTLHSYPITVRWTGGKEGSGKWVAERSGEEVAIAAPPEYGGTGGATNPEELLTAAIGGCYAITLGIILNNRKAAFNWIEANATGEVEVNGPSLVYKSVKIASRVGIPASATEQEAALVRGKVEVTVEPELVRE